MKLVVTGGAGFIGSNLVDFLIEQGHRVIVVDDLSTGKEENINKKAEFIHLDISKGLEILIDLLVDVDCVFHLAAWARVQRSVEDPVGTNQANVGGGLNILEACRANKVPRVVMSSSSSVYGLQTNHEMSEWMKHNPMSPYGLQKSIMEQYCDMYAKLYKMQITSLRYFNVYGPRQVLEGAYSLVIGKFLAQKARGEAMTIYGDGEQTRAYTHVNDVVRANVLAASVDLKLKTDYWHEAFNIGTQEETSVNDIAKMLGGDVTHIIPNPRGEFEEKRKCANLTKSKNMLNWEPTIFIKEGIQKLLDEN